MQKKMQLLRYINYISVSHREPGIVLFLCTVSISLYRLSLVLMGLKIHNVDLNSFHEEWRVVFSLPSILNDGLLILRFFTLPAVLDIIFV